MVTPLNSVRGRAGKAAANPVRQRLSARRILERIARFECQLHSSRAAGKFIRSAAGNSDTAAKTPAFPFA
jgi:hypothetical protein